MLGYQNEVITSKGYINAKKHVTDYQGPARHSGERPIVIALSVRPKHILVISLFNSRGMKLCMIVNY